MEVEGIAELPAEANPLNESLLIHALQEALSGNNQQLITSKQQLEQWETREGYYVRLESVFSNHQLPSDIRLQAIIQIKNGIDRHWRRSAKSVISDAEKSRIRSGLLQTAIVESDRRLASLVALAISKIARFDFPTKWPDAITHLINAHRSFTGPEFQGLLPFQLRRVLLILLNVVKEVVLNRIGPGRVRLKSYVTELLVLLGSSFFESFQPDIIQEALSQTDQWPLLEATLEQSMLSIKIIRRLTVGLMDHPHEDTTVQEFWHKSLPLFQNTLHVTISSISHLDSDSIVFQLLRKNLCGIAKLHVAMAKENPTDFALLQSNQYEIVQMHWHIMSLLGHKHAAAAGYPPVTQVTNPVHDFDESRQALIDKLGLQSLLLLRACIKMINMPGRGLRYRKEEEKKADEAAMANMKAVIFSQGSVNELVSHIIMELLLFQPSDLREWEDEPDEWEKREELSGEDFEFAPRPCAEKLLLDLALHFKDLTIEQILKMLKTVTAPGYANILQKEAVYCAVGTAASILEKHLQFKELLESNLIPEVQNRNPEYKIIRRRIAKLVGQWSTIQATQGSRPIYYQVFQFLLNQEDPLNDQVVRVAAGRQLGTAVDAWEYNAQEFMPYADVLLSRMMALVDEVELPETKINLLNTISIIVERMEQNITPHAKNIVEMLPKLWDQSEEEHLMKQVILALLSRLFRSMKEDGANFHPLVFPIIRETIGPNSTLGYALMEDTLDLWCTVLQQTPTPSTTSPFNSDLTDLIQYLVPLFDQDSENLEKVIEIFETYISLAPDVIFSRNVLPRILTTLLPKLGTSHASQSGYITNAVEYALQNAFMLQGSAAVEELLYQMLSTGFFDRLMDGLKESWEAHQTTGPKAIHTKIQGIIETDYFSLLSRVTWSSPQQLIEALSKSESAQTLPNKLPNPNNEQGISAIMSWFLQEWLSHCEDVHDPGRRKLMTLAITRLLELPQPFMLNSMQSLLSLWTNIILELTEGNDDKSVDSLVYPPNALPVEDPEYPRSPDAKRRSVINRADPIHTVNLIELVRSALGSFIQRCGGEQAFREEVLVNVDKEVIDGFGQLGIL